MNVCFPTVSLRSIAGNGVVPSWDSTAINAPIAELNKTFIFEQISTRKICEIWLHIREQSKIF